MANLRAVAELFDKWARKNGAMEMGNEHWPRVEQVLATTRPSDGNYLEIGPGNGYSLLHMATTQFIRGQCCGVDVSREMIECARRRVAGLKNVHLVAADFLTWTPPSDIKFDLIFSMEVLYYFEDIAGSIRKATKLLAPNGELVVMVDYFQENPDSHYWPEELGVPLVLWSRGDYAASFAEAGLSEVSQTVVVGGYLERGTTLCTRGRRTP